MEKNIKGSPTVKLAIAPQVASHESYGILGTGSFQPRRFHGDILKAK